MIRPTEPASRPEKIVTRFAVPLGLFIVAMAFRLLSWHSVFQSSGVVPNGFDAFYHLRRIRYSIEHFPDVLVFDPRINFPAGGQPIWSPAFDWLIAALLVPVPGIEEVERFERLVVWFPALLGALTVVILYLVALHFYSRRVAIIASLVLSLLPGHVLYSRIGNVDHHVLVALLATVMLGLAMRLMKTAPGASLDSSEIVSSASFGLSIGAIVLVWPGTLLHVGVLQLAFILRMLSVPESAAATGWAIRLSIAHAVAATVVLPFSAGNEWVLWGSFSPVVLSNFQPIYLYAAGGVFSLLASLWRTNVWATSVRERVASAIGVGLGLLVVLFLALPELAPGIGDALSWFTKDEEFQSVVSESVPLVTSGDGTARATLFLAYFFFLTPFMIGFLAWRDRGRPERWLFLWWATAFFAIALVQWRFVNTYAVAHGLLIALCLDAAYRRMAPASSSRSERVATAAAFLTVFTVAITPSLRYYAEDVEDIRRSARGELVVPVGALRAAAFLTATARFLREHSPPIDEEPYSVLGPWSAGHVINYVAERPVVQDNFGDDVAPQNFRLAEAYFASRDEAEALELVSPLRTRYVLVRPVGSGHSQGYAPDSLFSRLHSGRGAGRAATKRDGAVHESIPPLEHHRLIYQSRPMTPGAKRPFATLFEIVPGALVVGRSTPGATVSARLSIRPAWGPRFQYVRTTRADAKGHYTLRLPYSNESLSENVAIASRYELASRSEGATEEERAPLVVPEAAVLGGETIEGPQFGSPP